MARRKTNEEFVREVYDLVGEDYVFLEEYSKAKDKIKCRHNICSHEWAVSPSSFLMGSRCPVCAGNVKKTDEQFKREIYGLVNSEYEFLQEYEKAKTKICCEHKKCGHRWKISPDKFLLGRRCPSCFGSVKKTNEMFKTEVYKLAKDEYIFLEEYSSNSVKIKCRHNIDSCGHEYLVTPSKFLQGRRCEKCAKNKRKTDKEFKEEILSLVGGEYDFLEPYTSSSNKITVTHNKCGHNYTVSPSNFINHGARCPKCNSPRSELIISKYLELYNIKHTLQHKMDNCRNKNTLPFDFAILNSRDRVILLIEFDGEQHYRAVKFFGGEEGFRQRKINDRIKNEYCFKNDIPLLRIPYWEIDNIEYILFDSLVEHGVIEEIKELENV